MSVLALIQISTSLLFATIIVIEFCVLGILGFVAIRLGLRNGDKLPIVVGIGLILVPIFVILALTGIIGIVE